MQICKDHWDKIRQGIEANGLSGLVAKNGKEAAEKATLMLKGDQTKESFDPLLNAAFMISMKATNVMGPDNALHLLAEGICPLCFLIEHCQCGSGKEGCGFNDWITAAIEEQVDLAQDMGLVPQHS